MNSRFPRRVSESVESTVDVTPVMNMFVILIPFLISMAVFTQLGTHRFFLPGNDGTDVAQKLEDLPLIVNLDPDRILASVGDIVLLEAGSDLSLAERLQQLESTLAGARSQMASDPSEAAAESRLVLATGARVPVQDVVRCLDVCRAAGWTNLGLAEGPGES